MRYNLDLHGYTVHEAWKKFNHHLDDCYFKCMKKTIVITGHGQISTEIQTWTHNHPRAEYAQRLDPNTGAYIIKLVKNKDRQARIQATFEKTGAQVNPLIAEHLKKLQKKYNK